MKTTFIIPSVLSLLIVLSFQSVGFSQEAAEPLDVSGNISVTNEGISTIPTLSLGKPAALFFLSVGKRFHFDPEFRYSLRGEPWSFVFRFRYDLIDREKFFFRVGLNPFTSFKSFPFLVGDVEKSAIEARRGAGLELYSNYDLGETISIGTFSIHGRGFDDGIPEYSHYLSAYTSIDDIPLFRDLLFNIRPQFFYLNIEGTDGIYVASNFSISWDDFPLSIASVVNQAINTDIQGNPDFLWNISLNYSFEF